MYNIIFICERQLTLIKFFIYFYTFSQTHIYARTLHKTKHIHTDRCTSTDKRHISVCILVGCGSSSHLQPVKRHPKAEKQIKPIDGAKIFMGRVAPPYGDALLGVYPTSKFFFDFFCIVCVRCFFSNFFVPIVFF